MVPSIAMLYQYFNFGTQLKSFKYCLSTLIIPFNITYSFTQSEIDTSIAMDNKQFNQTVICLHTVKW